MTTAAVHSAFALTRHGVTRFLDGAASLSVGTSLRHRADPESSRSDTSHSSRDEPGAAGTPARGSALEGDALTVTTAEGRVRKGPKVDIIYVV